MVALKCYLNVFAFHQLTREMNDKKANEHDRND